MPKSIQPLSYKAIPRTEKPRPNLRGAQRQPELGNSARSGHFPGEGKVYIARDPLKPLLESYIESGKMLDVGSKGVQGQIFYNMFRTR